MPNNVVQFDGSMVAAADYSAAAYQFRFVRVTGNRTFTVGVVTAGDLAYGILHNDPVTSEAGQVAVLGLSELQLGSGGITYGARIMSDTNGRGIAATAGEVALAIARESGSSGERVSVFVLGGGQDVNS